MSDRGSIAVAKYYVLRTEIERSIVWNFGNQIWPPQRNEESDHDYQLRRRRLVDAFINDINELVKGGYFATHSARPVADVEAQQ